MPANLVDRTGIPSSVLLAALLNNQFEIGEHQNVVHDGTTVQAAQSMLDTWGCQVGVLLCKVVEVDFSMDQFNPALYDASRGEGAAQQVVDQIRRVLPDELLTRAVSSFALL